MDYTKLGEQEGYVTVYPSGVNGWNIGSHDAYSVKRRTGDADDISFFRAMFDTLIKEGIADPKRIYVTGGSNGGVMMQRLVCHLADRAGPCERAGGEVNASHFTIWWGCEA